MINKVIMVGNLGRDPEVKHFEGNSAVAKFSIATNETYKDKNGEFQKQTEWHDIVVWNNLATVAEKYLKKGSLIYLEGKLTHRKWQDKEGRDRYSTEVVARTLKMLEKREGGGSFSGNMPSAENAPKTIETPAPVNTPSTPAAPANKVVDSADDDLPF